ncbi:TetR/AcrR family transcriptional regulator [Streptacidiphilus pinicola]|uniref:TetR/AcrR family transcriptional regulator n=1 Tax=Streptacidiphilus pinicola TaxID=2219663 RepID=A0A2X0IG11_9ACTN|nr:TetR/AcrR family transcriptional regulator [Streptacidiphilus pinicola]RAG83974.1 TetR/AcrR family transcriptional regulator [Streptacidiphilus pinicola]
MTQPSEPIPLSPEARSAALPLHDQDPSERADAARNRVKLLEAAAALIQERGAEHLTMDAVAAAACVGKGTVFRRFGDRAGLLLAVLDRTEREFQDAFMFGPPPLGPGADPIARLDAFGIASLRHLLDNMNLYLESDRQAASRYAAPPRNVRARHLSLLLGQAGVDGDLELLAQTLLGTLDATFVHHMLTGRGSTAQQLEAGWSDVVARITHRC